MLDDVERRRFLVNPTGEHPPPARIRLLNVELKESAGKLFILPRRGRFTSAQAHDHIFYANRHSGLHLKIPDDAVALVEQADHRDPVLHRCDADLLPGTGGRFGKLDPVALVLVLAALAAGREKQPEQRTGRC
jgi:hypothetical protein